MPWWNSPSDGTAEAVVRPYESTVTADLLKRAAESIRIVSDGGPSNENFKYFVRSEIFEAKKIGFLGFGYHDVVMSRLNIFDLVRERNSQAPEFYGTGFELPVAKRNELLASVPGINMGEDRHTVFDYLQVAPLIYQGMI